MKPLPMEDIDLSELYKLCKEYIDYIDGDEYSEDRAGDYEHYFMEVALTTVYGDEFFDFINKRTGEHEEHCYQLT